MTAIKVCIITFIFTATYLLASVATSNLFFYKRSNGSLIKVNNKVVGSRLLGQEFKSNKYFHSRPSLYHYKNNISGNSNLSYYSNELKFLVNKNLTDHLKSNYFIKPDLNLITESASGLDPHITYKGAEAQIERIAKETGINKELLIKLVSKKSRLTAFGLFGERIINVLELNLELERLYAKTTRPG